ncbi:type IX secretion system protein PorG [Robertkochia flava]|uniref:type IX secretion system protein PorG n=1 Tax=Robertkochia flava TaxID=3447986 RepID=UPI001CD02D22|nr:DUF6089 family protein [Robertkochia marina]
MRTLLVAILLCTTGLVNAQTYELGAFLGGSNYIGDVGSDYFIRPNQPAFGGLGKWNLSSRYAYRLSVIYTELRGDDAESTNAARLERDLSFKNKALEVSLGMEFNFVEFDLHDFSKPFTPYIYGGVSVLMHEDLYYTATTNAEAVADGSRSTFAIPMALGAKGKVGQHWVLGAELGARYSFSNNLDGSNPSGNVNSAERFGNVYSNDWFVFTGVTLTYTFIRKPCYSCYD